jgi:hypothetical protein
MMLNAQGWQWAKNFGSANDDYASSVCSDQSGNIFLSTRIFFPYGVVGSDTIPISGLYDIFITKIDRSGAYLWTKQAGGYNPNGGIESADDLEFENNTQSLFVSGTMAGSSKAIGTCGIGGDDVAFLSKLDLSGNCIWAKELANSGSPSMIYIALDNKGSVFMAGNTRYVSYFNGNKVVKPGGFLAKLNSSDGSLLWVKKIVEPGGSISDVTFFDSKLYIGGGSGMDKLIIDNTTVVCREKDAFVSQFDTAGNLIWVRTMGGPNRDYGGKVELDHEGNVYTCGIFQDSIYFDTLRLMNKGGKDIYFAKYNVNGSLLWVKQLNATGNLNATYPYVDENGDIYHIGSFSGNISIGNQLVRATTQSDMFISKYNRKGDCLGVVQVGNLSSGGISADISGGFYITGIFTNTANFNNYMIKSSGGFDVFVAKHDAITATSQPLESPQPQLLIYANPTTGKCTITIPDEFLHEKQLTLQVFDFQGKLIEKTVLALADGKIRLNLEAHAKGMYQVVVDNGRKSYTGKVVFE